MNKERLLQAWLVWEAERPELERHLIGRAFVKLCQGIPADVPELAREFEVSVASLRDYVAQLAEHGRITLEGDAITGAAGLSVAPASHRLHMAGHPLYTWCALDAVGIPAALGLDATIESSYADGGEVRIEVAASTPRTPNAASIRVVPPDQERHLCGGT